MDCFDFSSLGLRLQHRDDCALRPLSQDELDAVAAGYGLGDPIWQN